MLYLGWGLLGQELPRPVWLNHLSQMVTWCACCIQLFEPEGAEFQVNNTCMCRIWLMLYWLHSQLSCC
jgi:hypothetical protein